MRVPAVLHCARRAATPRGVEAPAESQRQISFPAGNDKPVVLKHKGRADQSIGYVAWRTSDFFADPQRARDTAVMGEVMGVTPGARRLV